MLKMSKCWRAFPTRTNINTRNRKSQNFYESYFSCRQYILPSPFALLLAGTVLAVAWLVWQNVFHPVIFDEPQDFVFVYFVYSHFLWLSLLHVVFTLSLFPASVPNKKDLIYYIHQSLLYESGKSFSTKRFRNLFPTSGKFIRVAYKRQRQKSFFAVFKTVAAIKRAFYYENNQNASNSLFAFEHKQLQTQQHCCTSGHSGENRLMRKTNIHAENRSRFFESISYHILVRVEPVNKKL